MAQRTVRTGTQFDNLIKMRKEAEQRWPCREPGCKGTNYAQISQLHRHCRAKHPDGIVLKHMKTGNRLDQVRRFQADYRLVKVGKDWVDGSAVSVQEHPLPDRKASDRCLLLLNVILADLHVCGLAASDRSRQTKARGRGGRCRAGTRATGSEGSFIAWKAKSQIFNVAC